ncbi:CRISPR system Cascade subunit CasE [Methylobacterium sp. 174MFSha1.1]|uniref:type I-E CRISPR-associated protein Cas6/Cse3/CasE n=1 Tax=Methylobacterium sp. 174MFSha1.1 TaxID=1502749 RepID=UPI0008EC0FAD|nr:type I-E CRISPR-associated protein Cas6/Cse3/CasE [Methylobacterium sp. 174MFSha1.1]SFU39441.1 CRISPR system Cascade subunit CasE [Methylobacterium sp. 174MFSha1.1]
MSLFLSRVRLRHAPDTAALARLLLPEDDDARLAAGHRLIWSLFADHPDRERDFLWREDGGSAWQRTTFLVLSAREPSGGGLFEVESKPFAPDLSVGQVLRFRLRAAPSFSVPSETKGERGVKVDPVWHRLKNHRPPLGEMSPDDRQALRLTVEREVVGDWLTRQGGQSGFRPVTAPDEAGVARPVLTIDGDVQRRLPYDAKRLRAMPGRRPRAENPRRRHPAVAFTTFDLEGEIVVEDPAKFLAALARGFGRAKAFGCGLMLIRRP